VTSRRVLTLETQFQLHSVVAAAILVAAPAFAGQ